MADKKVLDQHPTIKIRDASVSDAAFLVDFNMKLAYESEGKTLDLATITKGVQRALNSPDMCHYYVAVVPDMSERVIAQTMITYELTDWRDGVIWWIQSVFVHPDFRRQGVFSILYNHIMHEAHQSGEARCIRLYVETGNTQAIDTYYRLGMVDAGYKVLEAVVAPKKPSE